MRNLVSALIVGAALAGTAAQATTYTYNTDFVKNNNIFTNLNQQYPNTGSGVPGSGVGVANASYIFTPPAQGAANRLNYVDNGVSFDLTSDAVGHDFDQIDGGTSLVVPINVLGVTNLYLLMAAYNGTSFDITLTGTGGASETFTNIFLPDFNGGTIDSLSGDVADQTVFQVQDVGAGGSGNSSNGSYNNYSLTEVGLTLGAQFAGQSLLSASITSNGYETLLLGSTTASADASSAVPEPASWAMMLGGFGLVGGAMRSRRHRRAVRFI